MNERKAQIMTPELSTFVKKAQEIIFDNLYCTISTCTLDGDPWISPVFCAYDKQYNIYWCSAIEAKHSRLIEDNNRVAIVIFDSSVPEGTGKGVYMKGTASECDPANLESATKLISERANSPNPKTAADYVGDSPRRIYQFTPERVWTVGERVEYKGHRIDTKVEIPLAELRKPILMVNC